MSPQIVQIVQTYRQRGVVMPLGFLAVAGSPLAGCLRLWCKQQSGRCRSIFWLLALRALLFRFFWKPDLWSH